MSEPPLKKKRTLLDFFRKKQPKSDNTNAVKDKKNEAEVIDVDMAEAEPGKCSKSSHLHPVLKVLSDIESGASFDGKAAASLKSKANAVKDKKNEAEVIDVDMSEAEHGKSLKSSRVHPILKAFDDIESGASFDGKTKGYMLFGDTMKYDETLEYNMDSEMTDSQISQGGGSIKPDIPTKKPSQRNPNSDWKGKGLAQLNKVPDCMEKFQHLHSTENHTVLIKVPYMYDPKNPPSPHPPQYKDGWDNDHVKMPCSPQNEYPYLGKDRKQRVRKRWEIVEESLCCIIPGPNKLEQTILNYNTRYFGKWNFQTLKIYFMEELSDTERNHFFDVVIGKIGKLALLLPHLCTQPIPLLKKGKTKSITLSQQQIACLLANAFFCTYPRRNAKGRNSEFSNYPSINFNSLYNGMPDSVKIQKLHCIMHYFRRVTEKMPTGNVTFTRQCINQKEFPNWSKLDVSLRDLHVSSEGTIEDDGVGFLQVDFANKYLGGGVLTHGCVQEEIRFLICPEMIISRLFTEGLEKNESLIMKGCERFSLYDGYARTFEWKGNYDDSKTPRDDWGRLCTHVTAIDALVIHSYDKQFRSDMVKRELNKAFCGFMEPGVKSSANLPAVCTGNWGCGAFGGDKRLKALIQLMAASVARRDVCYYTFDDDKLKDDIYNIHNYLTVINRLGIDTIMTLIDRYEIVLRKSWNKPRRINLFDYIVKVFDGSLENTDSEPESPGSEMSQEMLALYSTNDSCMADEFAQKKVTTKRQLSEDYKASTP